jgi:hypothetical protein
MYTYERMISAWDVQNWEKLYLQTAKNSSDDSDFDAEKLRWNNDIMVLIIPSILLGKKLSNNRPKVRQKISMDLLLFPSQNLRKRPKNADKTWLGYSKNSSLTDEILQHFDSWSFFLEKNPRCRCEWKSEYFIFNSSVWQC